MRYVLSSIAVAALLIAAFSNVYASQMGDEYLNALKAYYHVSDEVIGEIIEHNIVLEELPVAFHIAQLAKTSPVGVAKQRAAGKSWREIANSHNLKSDIFLTQVFGENKSTTYSSICSKLNKTPKGDWKNIRFSDEEITNLVNLKLITSYDNYSYYEVMSMRDLGSNFVIIHNIIKTINAKTLKAQKAKNRSVAIAQ